MKFKYTGKSPIYFGTTHLKKGDEYEAVSASEQQKIEARKDFEPVSTKVTTSKDGSK